MIIITGHFWKQKTRREQHQAAQFKKPWHQAELLYRWGSYGNSRFKASCLSEGAFYIEIMRGPGRARPNSQWRGSTQRFSQDC